MNPYFSVITVTRNQSILLKDCVQSVDMQIFRDFEHIIQDGGQDADTSELIRSLKYPHIQYLREKDNGIYQALNKALERACGRYVIFLHSDDFLPDTNVLSDVYDALQKNHEPDLLYGDLNYVDTIKTQKIIRTWKSGPYKKNAFYHGWMPPHPALVVKKEVFERIGCFREEFKISGDYEWMLRAFVKHELSAVYYQRVLVHMRIGGVSNRSLRHRVWAWIEDARAWKVNGLTRPIHTLLMKKIKKIFQYL